MHAPGARPSQHPARHHGAVRPGLPLGAYGSASKKHENEWFTFNWLECDSCSESTGCSERCPRFAAIPWDQIGGFLFEPGSSSGLVRFPPRQLIENIVSLVKQNDGLILVNEVTTGIGRTGTWFGYQHYGITPDIVALGKGIGNGYPVSVAAFGSRVVQRPGVGVLRLDPSLTVSRKDIEDFLEALEEVLTST